MKVAIVGSRNINYINLKKYLPTDTTEIISGSAKGVDMILAFWDGKSKGTKYVIDKCNKLEKHISIIIIDQIDDQ